ncbi:MAG: TIGR02186 family protein [Nitrospiraceae bacterium]|nr:TIGR02186 family protein [Nitrospiraceae bacterium]
MTAAATQMMNKRVLPGFLISVAFVMLLIFALGSAADAQLTAQVDNAHVKMGFFYHGSSIEVSGFSDKDADIIVKISSPDETSTFGKKGRRAGLIWMNSGELKFENAPQLYHLYSTRGVESILQEPDLDSNVIGYGALSRRIRILPAADQAEKTQWVSEFFRFKQSSNLYITSAGSISKKMSGTGQEYFLKIPWPYQALPGDYTVTVFSVQDKKIIEKAEAEIRVEHAGLVSGLSTMAKEQGALYGIISVIVALAAGFGTGMIFKKGGGAH